MKFTCSQAALLRAINTCSKAVSVRTTIPILKGILINVENGRVKMTSSDLNMSIETSFDAQNTVNGSTVVPAKLLGDIVRKLPNSLVSITTEKEYGKLSLNCLGSDFDIVSLPAEEFPLVGGVSSRDFIELKKDEFKDLINKSVFSASIDEKKGILTGCLLNINRNMIEAVALDGFRMAIVRKESNIDKEKTVIIPANILSEIYKILNEDSGSDEISVLFEEKKAEFLTEDTRIIARLLEGEFIKYESILPSSWNTRITVNREDMLNSIERASLFAKEGKNNLIKIKINKDSLDIESRSEEGYVNEKLGADVQGEELLIGFNSKYLLDVLKVLGDEEIVFELGSSLSACLIKPAEGNGYTYLVLPVRISVS